ncbi:MAG TPA: DUF305 domain-containing protein [Pyrinomonadaceae bacterium]|jgi:uncharacterized protein (DUF305 family)
MQSFFLNTALKPQSVLTTVATQIGIAAAVVLICFVAMPVFAQQTDSSAAPVVVQPGAPGQPTKTLPSTTRAKLPPRSSKDVEFMQGMIMHHAQAVEMTDLIESRTQNKDIRLLGTRISQSQSDEMNFMKRWLELRGEQVAPPAHDMHAMHTQGHNMHSHQQMLMPGMLSPKQMEALRKAKGAEFDQLFLKGMIQHHIGALTMVKELFETAGAGQDAELFNFATDVDTGQRGEIKIMQTLLGEKP